MTHGRDSTTIYQSSVDVDMARLTTECLYEQIDGGEPCDRSEEVEVGHLPGSLSGAFHMHPQEISNLFCEHYCSRNQDCLGYTPDFTMGFGNVVFPIIRCRIAKKNSSANLFRHAPSPFMQKLDDTCKSTRDEDVVTETEISKCNRCIHRQDQNCIWCDAPQSSANNSLPGKCICINDSYVLETARQDLCNAFGYDRSHYAHCPDSMSTTRLLYYDMYWSSYAMPAIVVAVCVVALCGCCCGLFCCCCSRFCGSDNRNSRPHTVVIAPTYSTSTTASTTAVPSFQAVGIPSQGASTHIPDAVIVSIMPQPSAPPLPASSVRLSAKKP